MLKTVLTSVVTGKTVNKESRSYGIFSLSVRDDTVTPITISYGRMWRS